MLEIQEIWTWKKVRVTCAYFPVIFIRNDIKNLVEHQRWYFFVKTVNNFQQMFNWVLNTPLLIILLPPVNKQYFIKEKKLLNKFIDLTA